MADEPKTYTEEQVAARIEQELAGLKANQAELLKESKSAKAKLAAYDGIDPVEHKALKDAAADAERKRLQGEGDFKSLEKQLIERHQTELAGKDKQSAKMLRALEKRLVGDALGTALVDAGARPEFLGLLKLEGARYLRVKETDEDYIEHVVDPITGAALIADGSATPMDVKSLVGQRLKTQYPDAFNGSGSSGGGATRSNAGGGGAPKQIARGDGQAFLAHVGDLATGKVTYAPTE